MISYFREYMRFLIYALKIEVTFILEMLCYVNMSTEPQQDIRKDSINVSGLHVQFFSLVWFTCG